MNPVVSLTRLTQAEELMITGTDATVTHKMAKYTDSTAVDVDNTEELITKLTPESTDQEI